jgi:hypothetical protein
MTPSLWRRHVLPFTILLGLLALATIAGDYLLHRLNLVWIGRYLGIPGTLLIVGSLVYSLRKRKYITSGNPKTLLTLHEAGTWLGWSASCFLPVRASTCWASASTTSCVDYPRSRWNVPYSGMR